MTAPSELRDQLRSLSIPRDQRPGKDAAPARRGRSALTILFFLAALGLAGFIVWDKFGARLGVPPMPGVAPQTPAVRTVRVMAQTAPDRGPVLTATGKIVSDHQVEVSTKVSGQIVAMYFEQGDRVTRGQTLAEIEDIGPRARRDEAAAQLARSKAKVAYDQINLARTERLANIQQASEIELADTRRAAAESAAEVKAWEALLVSAEKILHDCKIEAPIAGTVLERNVEVGDFVAAEGGRGANANAQFAVIADMEKLRVEVDVSELDVNRLRTNMPCVIAPDSQKDRRYNGFVMWIDPGANYAKATVQVKVRILEPDDFLRVEGAAQVQFFNAAPGDADAATTALWVPGSAVRTAPDGGATSVFVVDADRWRARPVTLGKRSGDSVEVVAGLSVGQEIAAEQADALHDGDPVKR